MTTARPNTPVNPDEFTFDDKSRYDFGMPVEELAYWADDEEVSSEDDVNALVFQVTEGGMSLDEVLKNYWSTPISNATIDEVKRRLNLINNNDNEISFDLDKDKAIEQASVVDQLSSEAWTGEFHGKPWKWESYSPKISQQGLFGNRNNENLISIRKDNNEDQDLHNPLSGLRSSTQK